MNSPPVIAVTQRVEVIASYDERRDALDQRWSKFAKELGAIALPLPNVPIDQAHDLLSAVSPRMIVLSGGNSISSHTPDAPDAAPERDMFEGRLLELAGAEQLPVVGVCRGLQMINTWFGGGLSPIENHAGSRHNITQNADSAEFPTNVNSYHNWAIAPEDLAPDLTPLAWDDAGNIEAFRHSTQNVTAIMWHPEREQEPHPLDLELFAQALATSETKTQP